MNIKTPVLVLSSVITFGAGLASGVIATKLIDTPENPTDCFSQMTQQGEESKPVFRDSKVRNSPAAMNKEY